MNAELVIDRKVVFADGAILQMVLWRLPQPDAERPHGFKYRFYYGLADGQCVVRYDNERGKGDHRHIGDQEETYVFIDVETLVADFLTDVSKARGGRL
ncbi:MAG TPA: hypothetical protein ENI90_07155 [Methylothermaceae bacterium]|nr:hypothetical protein [Methylothermaceae bacterium]